jgi:hypothetical protein
VRPRIKSERQAPGDGQFASQTTTPDHAVPEIVLGELDPDLARTEPDAGIQRLIRASQAAR